VREIRYREIAADLRQRVESGEFTAGGLLPSEADLTRSYDASRVTIRRALESLREAGLVDSRQGFGWFVAVDRVRQNLAQLSTIERELAERGVTAERQILDFGFVTANAHVREVLGVEQVLRVRRLNLADAVPFARVTVWCPADLGASWIHGFEDNPIARLARRYDVTVLRTHISSVTPARYRSVAGLL
jgi:GntR family transcriptional regulator